MDDPILKACDLSVAWDGDPVVRDVTFELFADEMICLVGRSGSGKTSLFHALSGLVEPQEGKVYVEGEDVTGRPGRVSYMLQKDLLLEQRTIVDNVILPLLIRGQKKKQARQKVDPLFKEFGLDGTQTRYPFELSGGMRQRAALLRTYMDNSDIILMDEPFSALDALTRMDMQRWFMSMMGKLHFASVLITHDVDEAITLADRIMVLGSPEEDPDGASVILADIGIDRPRGDRADFMLSDEALSIKREVISYLQTD